MIGKTFLTIVYIIIFIVIIQETWKNDIDVFRTIKNYAKSKLPLATKFEEPKLTFKFDYIPQRISEGVEVYGIKWKEDYEEFRFYLSNTNNSSAISDVRIRLELPDGIVKSEVNQHSGSEGISFSQDNSPSGIYKNNKLVEVTKEYYNTLQINASKIFPKGFFEIRLLLKVLKTKGESLPGYIDVKYIYNNHEKETINKHIAHDILFKDNDKTKIYIDTSREIQNQEDRQHYFSMTFDEPLVLGNPEGKNKKLNNSKDTKE